MNLRDVIIGIGIVGFVGWTIFSEQIEEAAESLNFTPVTPDWTAIESWGNGEGDDVLARPDPNQRITVIVLDDSGSMGNDIDVAKAAVLSALDSMAENDRVAVWALNAGQVLSFSNVEDARAPLSAALKDIHSHGSTPLTFAVEMTAIMLSVEAKRTRGFGTFRLILTTDGMADDEQALNSVITNLAAKTPIQLTTIGIGLSGKHVLRRQDLGGFVDVANVDALGEALQAAVAENTDFEAITDFSTGG
jgi:hypothetical protein